MVCFINNNNNNNNNNNSNKEVRKKQIQVKIMMWNINFTQFEQIRACSITIFFK